VLYRPQQNSLKELSAASVLSAVSLSHDRVQRYIDEMNDSVLKHLVEIMSVRKHSLD